MSPLRKKSRLPFIVIKSSSKEVSSAEKTKVGAAPLSSARVNHLVDADSKNIGDMRDVRDILLYSSTN